MEKFFEHYRKQQENRTVHDAVSAAILGLDFSAKMKNWIFVYAYEEDEAVKWLLAP